MELDFSNKGLFSFDCTTLHQKLTETIAQRQGPGVPLIDYNKNNNNTSATSSSMIVSNANANDGNARRAAAPLVRTLNLSYNQLHLFTGGEQLQHLTHLYLGHNKLPRLYVRCLPPRLRVLAVPQNGLQGLAGGCLARAVPLLEELDLSGNQLTAEDLFYYYGDDDDEDNDDDDEEERREVAFHLPPSLLRLDLRQNQLRSLAPLAPLHRLVKLNLAGNAIAAVEEGLGTLPELISLRTLDLRGNPVFLDEAANLNTTTRRPAAWRSEDYPQQSGIRATQFVLAHSKKLTHLNGVPLSQGHQNSMYRAKLQQQRNHAASGSEEVSNRLVSQTARRADSLVVFGRSHSLPRAPRSSSSSSHYHTSSRAASAASPPQPRRRAASSSGISRRALPDEEAAVAGRPFHTFHYDSDEEQGEDGQADNNESQSQPIRGRGGANRGVVAVRSNNNNNNNNNNNCVAVSAAAAHNTSSRSQLRSNSSRLSTRRPKEKDEDEADPQRLAVRLQSVKVAELRRLLAEAVKEEEAARAARTLVADQIKSCSGVVAAQAAELQALEQKMAALQEVAARLQQPLAQLEQTFEATHATLLSTKSQVAQREAAEATSSSNTNNNNNNNNNTAGKNKGKMTNKSNTHPSVGLESGAARGRGRKQ